MLIDSVKTSLRNQLQTKNKGFSDMSTIQVVVIVMSEIDKITYLTGPEKEEYCVDYINSCDLNMVHDLLRTIRTIIDITKGKYNINKTAKMFCCFGF
jgi:hypothetical protein